VIAWRSSRDRRADWLYDTIDLRRLADIWERGPFDDALTQAFNFP
jgi:hypothetical protein